MVGFHGFQQRRCFVPLTSGNPGTEQVAFGCGQFAKYDNFFTLVQRQRLVVVLEQNHAAFGYVQRCFQIFFGIDIRFFTHLTAIFIRVVKQTQFEFHP